eukprot:GILI01032200.1.p1 GENE.GILI01032200.1~~GILI01032200.1.p1  ORF type:complete len:186 (-),score=49.55 GILI01032200.1:16-522(-)
MAGAADVEIVKLQSSDGHIIAVPTDVAFLTKAVKNLVSDVGLDQLSDGIELPSISHEVLQKVVEWATHHKDDPAPAEDDENRAKRADDIDQWDADFCKVKQPMLFELILAANYLDMKGLLDLTCKTVANIIRGKNPEQIRAAFNIRNDFTPEEEEQVRKENEWCEESK